MAQCRAKVRSRIAETVKKLIGQGHQVIVQSGAGVNASQPDSAYEAAGATIGSAAEAFGADRGRAAYLAGAEPGRALLAGQHRRLQGGDARRQPLPALHADADDRRRPPSSSTCPTRPTKSASAPKASAATRGRCRPRGWSARPRPCTSAPSSRADQVVVRHGVTIVGHSNLAALVPADASALYARNILDFLKLTLNAEGLTGENDGYHF
ncbi:hypothetical protein [Pseudomonas aeruginosa]|uniref:hypothetical protein n=1 Tax=Pseudomonas aeruginosa TaxID=287 RepID=UPI002A90A0CA|nr:hypothetical protein [Pseudomonas aeruginosa]